MNNDISIYEAHSVHHRREMQINVLHPTTVGAFSIQRIMYDACRYRLQPRYIENIPVAGLSCTLRSLLPLAPELRPSICISIRGLGNVIEPGVDVVDGPGDHRRSSGIASRASRNVLTTSGLFYRFAKRHIVTFDRSYVYHACVRIYLYADTRRQGRVSIKYIRYILFYITLYISVSVCPRFPIYK